MPLRSSTLTTLAALLTGAAATPAQDGARFAEPLIVGSGAGTIREIVLADLDADGHEDVVALANGGTLHVAWSAGDLTFSEPLELPGPDTTAPPVVVDLDEDGWPDIAAYTADALRIWFGEDGHAFAPAVVSDPDPLSDGWRRLATGDFDGDGHADLLLIRVGPDVGPLQHELEVLLGDGAGGLQSAGAAAVEPGEDGPSGLRFVVGDFDGDGTDDLLQSMAYPACPEASRLLAHLSQGDGTFAPPVTTCKAGNQQLVLDDLDGDPFADLLVLGQAERIVEFLRGDGTGGFTLVDTLLEQDVAPFGGAFRDVDDDGLTDLVLGTHSETRLLLRDAPTGFAAPVMSKPQGLQFVLAQLDGEGLLDLIRFDSKNQPATVPCRADGTYASTPFEWTPSNTRAIKLADFDQDGIQDLLLVAWWSGPAADNGRLWRGTPDGHHELVAEVDVGLNPVDVDVGDLNGDGLLDIVTAGQTGGDLNYTVLAATSTSFYRPRAVFGGGFSVLLADFDGDATLDLMSYGGGVTARAGKGDGSWKAPLVYDDVKKGDPLGAGDMDLDGHLDLVTGGGISLGMGDGRLQPYVPFPEAVQLNAARHALGDVDEDGLLDVAILQNAGPYPSVLRVLRGLGDGSVSSTPLHEREDTRGSLVLDDLDADGHLDLVLSANEREYSVIPGDGRGGFGPTARYRAGDDSGWATHRIAIHDVNRDGHRDLILAPLSNTWRTYVNQVGPWKDLGFAAGPSLDDQPRLLGAGPLTPGSTLHVGLRDAPPAAPGWLVAGSEAALAPTAGGVLVPLPQLIVPLLTNADGVARASSTVPAGLPAGVSWFFHARVDEGEDVLLSNALRADLVP